MITAPKLKERTDMNIQTLIYSLLAFTVLILAMLVVIVVFVGILRIAIISVFDFDFIVWFKTKPKRNKNETKKFIGLYKGGKDEN